MVLFYRKLKVFFCQEREAVVPVDNEELALANDKLLAPAPLKSPWTDSSEDSEEAQLPAAEEPPKNPWLDSSEDSDDGAVTATQVMFFLFGPLIFATK